MNELSTEETIVAERLGITELCLIQYTRDGKVTVSSLSSTNAQKFRSMIIVVLRILLQAVNELVWNRFLRALIIYDLWNKHSIWDVSNKFNVARGTIHTFLLRVTAFTTSVQRFTEVRFQLLSSRLSKSNNSLMKYRNV